jgi:hypothetical protein
MSEVMTALKSTLSILPDNRTLLERALEQTICQSLLELDSVYPELWDPYKTPDHLLPYLAQAKGVPDWGEDTPKAKQDTVANIWPVQRQAGTRKAVKQAVDALGFDASVSRGGAPFHLKVDLWREDVGTLEADIIARARRRIGYVKSERDVINLTLNASSEVDLYIALSAGAACFASSAADVDGRVSMPINVAIRSNYYLTQTVTECY